MQDKNHTDFDVLSSIDITPLETVDESIVSEGIDSTEIINTTLKQLELDDAQAHCEEQVIIQEKKSKSILQYGVFFVKYCFTCGFIFALLLVSTNFSAYFNIAKGYVFSWELQKNEKWLLNSVEAGSITTNNEKIEKVILKSRDEKYEQKVKELEKEDDEIFHSISTLAAKTKNQEINLNIEIAPYENRIVIPKIGKNIPLLDVKDREVSWVVELNDIFMEELENGVVRYPGSAKPWEKWNAFIFGHSSDFPWSEWDYKDVFALLHKLTVWDEVIVYYGQRKYTYRMKEKQVIRPGDVDILKRDKWVSELTLMTCWPVGTTLNRMILIWELVED